MYLMRGEPSSLSRSWRAALRPVRGELVEPCDGEQEVPPVLLVPFDGLRTNGNERDVPTQPSCPRRRASRGGRRPAPLGWIPAYGDLWVTNSIVPQELPSPSFLRKQESKNAVCKAALAGCLGRRALDSRLHGNDGEDSLFQEIHRSYEKVCLRRKDGGGRSGPCGRLAC